MVDMDKICRACLRNEQELFLLFDEKYTEDLEGISIAAVISECTMYKVERFDELPHLICGTCMDLAKSAFRFKRTCERSHRTLLSYVGKSSQQSLTDIKIEPKEMMEKYSQTDDSTMYPCERCEAKFFTFDALRTHRENEHKGGAIVCRFCAKSFNRVGYLKTHIAVFHPETGYISHNQCHICQRQFTRREHMRRHMAVIHKIVEVGNEGAEKADTDLPYHIGNYKSVSMQMPQSACLQAQSDKCNFASVLSSANQCDEFPVQVTELATDANRLDDKASFLNLIESDDEDEKPLSCFVNAAHHEGGFMEVLLKEAPTSEKLPIHEDVFTDNAKLQCFLPSSKTATKTADALLPVQRCSGRSPRLVVTQSFASRSSSTSSCSPSKESKASGRNSKKRVSVGKQYQCRICSKSFKSANQLSLHMNIIHESKVMKCEESKQIFTNLTQLKRHKESKHGESCSHQCEICAKTFTTKIYLQRHMAVHGKKRFICKECSQSYTSKDELHMHIKAQGHDKPMLCPECGLRCKTSNILMVHMRRHKGEKPFKCKFCSKGFPRMDDLRVHEKYHTGEKSHFCETCGKGFQRKYNLTIHLRVHTGEKPYKCPHCEQAFAQGNDLKAHIRRHTGERFRCEVCGAAFLQGYQIRQHKLIDHGIKEDPPTQRVAKFTSPEEQQQQIKQNMKSKMSQATDVDTEIVCSVSGEGVV